ncbi:hypothetical protein AcW1_006605 [Taiwanofungus camphoratus]|nr:hypothetical protein AcW1_006605 [Antrodia cinnamomea]
MLVLARVVRTPMRIAVSRSRASAASTKYFLFRFPSIPSSPRARSRLARLRNPVYTVHITYAIIVPSHRSCSTVIVFRPLSAYVTYSASYYVPAPLPLPARTLSLFLPPSIPVPILPLSCFAAPRDARDCLPCAVLGTRPAPPVRPTLISPEDLSSPLPFSVSFPSAGLCAPGRGMCLLRVASSPHGEDASPSPSPSRVNVLAGGCVVTAAGSPALQRGGRLLHCNRNRHHHDRAETDIILGEIHSCARARAQAPAAPWERGPCSPDPKAHAHAYPRSRSHTPPSPPSSPVRMQMRSRRPRRASAPRRERRVHHLEFASHENLVAGRTDAGERFCRPCGQAQTPGTMPVPPAVLRSSGLLADARRRSSKPEGRSKPARASRTHLPVPRSGRLGGWKRGRLCGVVGCGRGDHWVFLRRRFEKGSQGRSQIG